MSKAQVKLFDFNRNGSLIDNETIVDSRIAREFVTKLQEKKAMAQNWKLDIFIDDTVVAVCIGEAPKDSAAYRQGVFEYSVGVVKLRYKGHPNLEEKGSCSLAYFPTREKALDAVSHIIAFIAYRYNMHLALDETFKERSWKR